MAVQNQMLNQFDYDWAYSSQVSILFGIFAVVAAVGWMVSVMLTAIHLFALPAIPAGSEALTQGSIAVITSPWAYVLGIPLATFGAIYYLATLGLTLWWFDTRHPLIIKILTPMTASGVLFSAYFVYLQLGVIGEICPFCMVSASATVILFGLELGILRLSDTPSLSAMVADVGGLVTETNYAVVAIPVLVGALTVAGMFVIPMLPMPEVIPFID